MLDLLGSKAPIFVPTDPDGNCLCSSVLASKVAQNDAVQLHCPCHGLIHFGRGSARDLRFKVLDLIYEYGSSKVPHVELADPQGPVCPLGIEQGRARSLS